MAIFMGMYFAAYALLNLYVCRWLRPAFNWQLRGTLVFCGVALAMMLLPVTMHWCDKRGHFLTAQLAAVFGYSWMLLAMWVFSFGFPVEIWNFIIAVLTRAVRSAGMFRISPRVFVGAIAVISAVLTTWGVIEAHYVRLNTITIKTPRFPPTTPPLRVLHIGDAHFSSLVSQRHCEQIVGFIKQEKPDMLVCTGDMFDSADEERLGDFAVALNLAPAPLGKFAVLGNHEYYTGLDSSLFLFKIAEFKVLRAENVTIKHDGVDVVIAGVDDPAGAAMGEISNTDEEAALPPAAGRPFTIFLKHQPLSSENIRGRFDLQLSGHSHWGQVFPFQFYVRLFYPMYRGMHIFPDGSRLWVTPGAGTWGPPVRVLAPPEVTLFVIQPE